MRRWYFGPRRESGGHSSKWWTREQPPRVHWLTETAPPRARFMLTFTRWGVDDGDELIGAGRGRCGGVRGEGAVGSHLAPSRVARGGGGGGMSGGGSKSPRRSRQ